MTWWLMNDKLLRFWQESADICSWYCPSLDRAMCLPHRNLDWTLSVVERYNTAIQYKIPHKYDGKYVQIEDIEWKPLVVRGDGHGWWTFWIRCSLHLFCNRARSASMSVCLCTACMHVCFSQLSVVSPCAEQRVHSWMNKQRCSRLFLTSGNSSSK